LIYHCLRANYNKKIRLNENTFSNYFESTVNDNKKVKRLQTAPTKNWRFSASYDSFVVNQTFVLRMNICGKNRQLLVAAKRYLDTIQGLLKKIISGSGIPKRAILHLSECPPKIN